MPNVWDTAKTLRIGTFLFANAYIKKEERCQINNVNFNLTKLEKEEQIKSQ